MELPFNVNELIQKYKNEEKMRKTQYNFCLSCGRVLEGTEFYLFKDGTQDQICKDCIVKDFNPNKEETFIPLLKRYDIPYFPYKMKQLDERNKKEGKTKKATFGQYLCFMKLKTFKQYGYKDSYLFSEEKII